MISQFHVVFIKLFVIIALFMNSCVIYNDPVRTVTPSNLDSLKKTYPVKIKVFYVGKLKNRLSKIKLTSFEIKNDSLYGLIKGNNNFISIPIESIKYQLLVNKKNFKGVKIITSNGKNYVFTEIELKNDRIYGKFKKKIEIPVNDIVYYEIYNKKASTITTIILLTLGISTIVYLSLAFTIGMSGYYGP